MPNRVTKTKKPIASRVRPAVLPKTKPKLRRSRSVSVSVSGGVLASSLQAVSAVRHVPDETQREPETGSKTAGGQGSFARGKALAEREVLKIRKARRVLPRVAKSTVPQQDLQTGTLFKAGQASVDLRNLLPDHVAAIKRAAKSDLAVALPVDVPHLRRIRRIRSGAGLHRLAQEGGSMAGKIQQLLRSAVHSGTFGDLKR